MIKKYAFILFAVLYFLFSGYGIASASLTEAGTPEEFLDRIVQTSNSNFKTQKTQLDDVSDKSSRRVGAKFKITGTLGNISQQIEPYLQRLTFIGMTLAVILLTWNGFKLVTNSSGMIDGGDIKTVKGNIQTILTGVIILTGFIAIIKIIMAVVNLFFGQ